MHTFLHQCLNLITVSSTCFEHSSVHLQEDLYMQFYGIFFIHPYKFFAHPASDQTAYMDV